MLRFAFLVGASVAALAASAADAVTFSYNGAIQSFVVPTTGLYSIFAAGAQGGNTNSATGGLGARVSGSFALTSGDTLYVVVGGRGTGNDVGGGGGGGTFIYKDLSTPLAIAGGGGGAGDSNGGHGLAGTNGGGASFFGANGLGGQGGSQYGGGGGAGFLSNGGDARLAYGGHSAQDGYYAFNGGYNGGNFGGVGNGGFGGGGGAGSYSYYGYYGSNSYGGGGGGGGFSGGRGGDGFGVGFQPGLGGGSFLAAGATNTSLLAGVNSGYGSAGIDFLGGGGGGGGGGGTGAVPEPSSWAMLLGGFGLIGMLLRRRRLRTA